jgi:hypothetical protein
MLAHGDVRIDVRSAIPSLGAQALIERSAALFSVGTSGCRNDAHAACRRGRAARGRPSGLLHDIDMLGPQSLNKHNQTENFADQRGEAKNVFHVSS